MKIFGKQTFNLIMVGVTNVLILSSCAPSVSWKQSLQAAQKYHSDGDYKNALKFYYLANGEMDKARADKAIQLDTLSKMIALEKKQNNQEAVEKLSEKAIPMADLSYGPTNLKLIPFLADLRDAVSRHPDRDKSAALLERIISIQEVNSGSDSIQLMWYLEDYAKSTSPTCGDRFDPNKLRHLVALREKHFGANNKDTIRDKLVLADVLGQSKESQKEAEKLYLECINAAQTQGKNALVANCSLRYARFLRREKRIDDALPYLKEAYAISGPGLHYSSLLGPEIADLLGEALETDGKRQEAKQVYSSILAYMNKQNLGQHPMYSGFSEKLEHLKN